ncbi:helix-turn-helix domain-containing protein [Candidatus Micrarchaeota archaeon]|nr:helix-turn-helix domain-containing protein [Candidatus Micrarchaeota archaeon]
MAYSLGGKEADCGAKRHLSVEDAIRSQKFRADAFFSLHSAKSGISKKQLEAFREAIDSGYYETPKKITISELSERFGTSPSTMAEHLRKTKSKLIRIFWDFMEKI